MRTKHLFYTMALAAAFSACTNEELVPNAPQTNSNVIARPTLSGVTLSTGDDTRLAYGGKDNGTGGSFTWENGDEIAVMLMDQNNTGIRFGSSTLTDEWDKLTWLERYHLVDYVHTNYPFTYENGKFKTDANMLEGNYFLVYPFLSFNGQRQAYFDISNQKQVGNTAEGRKEAYGSNQHFVGYARLDATAGNSEIKAKMSEILAPLRVNIQSNCTEVEGEELEVYKIVLAHPTFHSQYTIDPTTASYPAVDGKNIKANAWNLVDYKVKDDALNQDQNAGGNAFDIIEQFNYANYLTAAGLGDYKKDLYLNKFEGSVNGADYVYNVDVIGEISDKWSEKEENNQRPDNKYYYDEAIRATVKPLWKGNWSENTTNYVEVYTYDSYTEDAEGNVISSKPMLLKSGYNNALGVVAMVPAFNDWKKEVQGNGLQLYIYTNKGLVGPIDMSYKHAGAGADVQTSDAVLAADPRIAMNTVTVIIDDPDIVRVPDQKIINNTDDLKDYVKYLTQHATNSRIDIMLSNDVTIDDELAESIKAMKEDKGVDNVTLYMSGMRNMSKRANLRLATTDALTFDILEFLDIDESLLVQIESGATVDLTWRAHNYESADSKLYILVDKGGQLNITDPNNSSVGGWSDAANFDRGMHNVYVTNNGNVNVKSKVYSNAGIQLTNGKGTFTVEMGASITLARNSENQLNGKIVVEAAGTKINDEGEVETLDKAVLSGSINENLVNRGIIENYGEIYSVVNRVAANNSKRVIPGRILIMDANAETSLASNRGIVQYYVLPVTAVEVLDGDYTQGMFIYDTTVEDMIEVDEEKVNRCRISSTTTGALNINFVTDAIFKENETLSVSTNSQISLRHLTLNSATLQATSNATTTFDNLVYANPVATGTPAFGADWNNGRENKNQLISNGETTINGVKVTLSNTDFSRNQVIFNHAKASEGISLSGAVEFYAATAQPAEIMLNDVLVVLGGVITGQNNLYAPAGVASEVRLKVGATWAYTNGSQSLITVNKKNSGSGETN